jgi:5,10-methylenetetrahydromethanopterin reductase
VIAGTPEEVDEHARALYDAGAHRVEFGTPQGLTTRNELRCRRVVRLLRR